MKLSNLRSYAFLARQFRNAPALIQGHRRQRPVGQAVEWSGRRIQHPPERGGLVGTLLEVWGEGCYDDVGRLAAGDVVVDAGAHVGLFSIRTSLRHPHARVLAFEPTAANHACLLANVRSYGVEERVTVRRCAIGGARGFARMRTPTQRSIDHRAVAASAADVEAVPVLSLDDVVEEAGGEVAFLKMDIEGGERAAFARARPETLAALRRIALEYHDNLVPGTLRLLRQRLAPTHHLRVTPTGDRGYGLLVAERRSPRA
jgi:FkbM family methyltransferase